MLQQLKIRIISRLLWLYLYFVGITSKIINFNFEHRRKLEEAGQTYIYALWHGRQVMFAYTHRNSKVSPLVSPSKDGEIFARVLQLFGITPSRGSSSKTPRRALINLINKIKQGYCLGLTPDGPRGPERTIKPGTLYLAKRFGLPILPIANAPRRRLVFRGWDTFIVPLPFNRISVVYGKPFWIKENESLEEKALQLKIILDDVTQEADRSVLY